MILVGDDHADTRQVLCVLLLRYGYEVCAVASGVEALQQLSAVVPHCIILDYNMPEMDGLDVLRAVREQPRYNRVNIIMFTAQSDWELEAAALKAGANGFVVKTSL